MSYNEMQNNVLQLQGMEVRQKTKGQDSVFSSVSIAGCVLTPIAPLSTLSAFAC